MVIKISGNSMVNAEREANAKAEGKTVRYVASHKVPGSHRIYVFVIGD